MPRRPTYLPFNKPCGPARPMKKSRLKKLASEMPKYNLSFLSESQNSGSTSVISNQKD